MTAVIPDDNGDDAVSRRIDAMPISARTFAPWVNEVGYRTITLEWWDNPNVSKYTLERAVTLDGPWEVHRSLAASKFIDSYLDHDTEYYYRVTPETFATLASDPVSATRAVMVATFSAVPAPTGPWMLRLRARTRIRQATTKRSGSSMYPTPTI